MEPIFDQIAHKYLGVFHYIGKIFQFLNVLLVQVDSWKCMDSKKLNTLCIGTF